MTIYHEPTFERVEISEGFEEWLVEYAGYVKERLAGCIDEDAAKDFLVGAREELSDMIGSRPSLRRELQIDAPYHYAAPFESYNPHIRELDIIRGPIQASLYGVVLKSYHTIPALERAGSAPDDRGLMAITRSQVVFAGSEKPVDAILFTPVDGATIHVHHPELN